MKHHAKLAKNTLQVLQEVLEAMTEAVQKQQSTRDTMQQRLDEVNSTPGCNKQRPTDLKDLEKDLCIEETQLQKKQQLLKEAQSLRDRWEGEHLAMTNTTSCTLHGLKHSCNPALLRKSTGRQHTGADRNWSRLFCIWTMERLQSPCDSSYHSSAMLRKSTDSAAVLAKHLYVYAESSDGPAQSDASPGTRDRLIELGGDDLAEKLDILHGDEVIDHSIITCGPSHSEKCTHTSCICSMPTNKCPSEPGLS